MRKAIGVAGLVFAGLMLAGPAGADAPGDEAAMKLAGFFVDTKFTRDVSGKIQDAMFKVVMDSNPGLPPAAGTIVHKEIAAAFDDLAKRKRAFVSGRLKAQLSPEDIKVALAFFEGPAGGKVVDVFDGLYNDIPVFVQKEGSALTQTLQTNLRERLVAAGYLGKDVPLKLGR